MHPICSIRMNLDERRKALRSSLLAYLGSRPEARDTVEGVQSWWLAPAGAWTREEIVEELEVLVGCGSLQRWPVGDAVLYGAPVREEQ